MTLNRLFALFSYLVVSTVTAAELTAEQIGQLRSVLESQYVQTTGVKFVSFECDVPASWPQSREFVCDVVDADGDKMFYRMMFDEPGGAPRFSMSQPVG